MNGSRWRINLPGTVMALVVAGLASCRTGSAATGGTQVDGALQPENVAVVVNADSWASAALADAYVELRGIPPEHVIAVSGLSSFEEIGIDEFREKILTPVLNELGQRGLKDTVDCLAYSSDIPYAISFRGDLDDKPHPPHVGEVGALTGLTYLYEAVLARDPQVYTALDSNFYARRAYRGEMAPPRRRDGEAVLRPADQGEIQVQPPRRFRARTTWARYGEPTNVPAGRRYLLSTMLGVTSGRGLSLREAVDGLARAAAADGTRPAGTIVYMINDDVRTQTRRWGFESAVRLLKEAGVAAVIEKGALPNGRQDIAGAMVGVATFDMTASGGQILPGAICEHLTSGGGIVKWGEGQTPLTEFLRHGAAGASGTVAEPFAIQAKFPDPFIQVHYVRGASLAEAFYQSVGSPYQLLIVGDPLCRPWGKTRAPAVAARARRDLPAVTGPLAADTLAGGQALGRGFRAIGPNGARVVSGTNGVQPWWELAEIAPGSELTIDGYIEARTNGVHQFQVLSSGEVKLTVSGQSLPATGRGPWRTYPVALEPGWHAVRLDARAAGSENRPVEPPLELNFGAVGAPPLMPQLWCYPRRGDRIRNVGLGPQVILPEMTNDSRAIHLRFAVNGLQPTTSGTLTMQWELPEDSGWAIEPAHAETRIDKGVVEPVPFRVHYRGAPFRADDFFPTGCGCDLQVRTAFGTESAESVGLPLDMIRKERPRPQIDVRRAVQPPKIDGRLDDDAWSGPATIARFVRSGFDRPLGQPTAAWLAWDEQCFYLAARCTEPHLDRLQLAAKKRDAPVFADDSVEFFVAFDDAAPKYYQVVVNAAGMIYDGAGYDASWNGDYQVATGRETGGWTVEIAMPWKTFGAPPPKPGATLRILVGRNRHAVQLGEISTWPAAPGGNHQPRLFGKAHLIPASAP